MPPDPVTGVGSALEALVRESIFKLEVARTPSERAYGLMERASLPEDAAMLFVYEGEEYLSFWMKNTIVPLDVAYVATDGTVVNTYTMTPLDDRPNAYPPGGSYRYAIETLAPRLEELGLSPGDVLSIPAEVLKGAS